MTYIRVHAYIFASKSLIVNKTYSVVGLQYTFDIVFINQINIHVTEQVGSLTRIEHLFM